MNSWIEQIKALGPICAADQASTDNDCCILGRLAQFLNRRGISVPIREDLHHDNPIENFPNLYSAIELLRTFGISYNKAFYSVERIIIYNDNGDFDSAWAELEDVYLTSPMSSASYIKFMGHHKTP
jgi:hypothetical protein